MIDIETLGVNYGDVILSVAAVKFDIETGETFETFYKKISFEDSTNFGFKINPKTITWWLKENPKVLSDNITGGESLSIVLVELGKFIEKDDIVWGNSNRFDLGLLEAYYKTTGIGTSWNFRNERDVRTLVSFAPEVKANLVFDGEKHNPLHDCYHQIKYCSEIYKKLKL